MTGAAASGRAEGRRPWRWVIIGLIFSGTLINYIDRQTVAILAPMLQRDLHLSNLQYAGISTWFLVTYSLSMWVWGSVFDRLGNRVGYALAAGWWSLAEMAHAFARGLGGLGAMRAILGAGESGNWPGATRTVAAWFGPRQRALGMGLANAGAAAGSALAPPIIVGLQLAFGWRTAFLATGVLGLVWTAAWLVLCRPDPAAGTSRADEIPPGAPVPWATLLRNRAVWGIVLARFFGDPIWWLYLNWLPLYLSRVRGFSLREIGLSAWMPFLAAGIGSMAGGWFSGFLIDRDWTVNRARKTAIAAGTLCMPAGILAAYAASPYAALAWISVTLFGFQFWVGNVQTLPSDFFPVGAVGSIAGFSGTAAGLGAVIFTLSTGWVVDHFTYTPVLVAAGVLAPVATLVLFWLIGAVRPIAFPDGTRIPNLHGHESSAL